MTNLELIKQAYADFASGNIPTVLPLFDPAVEWHESKGMPFVEGDGIYKGVDAIVKGVFMNLPVHFDGFNMDIKESFEGDNKVAVAGHYKGTNKATGNVFKANFAHVWTLKNGKVTRMFQTVDTKTVLA